MNLISLFAQIPWALVAAFLAANAIPYLSAWLTPKKGWWTGIATMALSFLNGLFSVIANYGDPVNWKAVIGTAFGSWFVAGFHHSKVLANTAEEKKLQASGVTVPRGSTGAVANAVPIAIVIVVIAVLLGVFAHPLFWLLLFLVVILFVV